jgi:hypothetical protein
MHAQLELMAPLDTLWHVSTPLVNMILYIQQLEYKRQHRPFAMLFLGAVPCC